MRPRLQNSPAGTCRSDDLLDVDALFSRQASGTDVGRCGAALSSRPRDLEIDVSDTEAALLVSMSIDFVYLDFSYVIGGAIVSDPDNSWNASIGSSTPLAPGKTISYAAGPDGSAGGFGDNVGTAVSSPTVSIDSFNWASLPEGCQQP